MNGSLAIFPSTPTSNPTPTPAPFTSVNTLHHLPEHFPGPSLWAWVFSSRGQLQRKLVLQIMDSKLRTLLEYIPQSTADARHRMAAYFPELNDVALLRVLRAVAAVMPEIAALGIDALCAAGQLERAKFAVAMMPLATTAAAVLSSLRRSNTHAALTISEYVFNRLNNDQQDAKVAIGNVIVDCYLV